MHTTKPKNLSLLEEIVNNVNETQLELSAFTDMAEAPEEQPWPTIAALYGHKQLEMRIFATYLNGIFTCGNARFITSVRSLIASLEKDPNSRKTINDKEYKRVIGKLQNGGHLIQLHPPSEFGDPYRRAGAYELKNASLLALLVAKFGAEHLERQARKFDEGYGKKPGLNFKLGSNGQPSQDPSQDSCHETDTETGNENDFESDAEIELDPPSGEKLKEAGNISKIKQHRGEVSFVSSSGVESHDSDFDEDDTIENELVSFMNALVIKYNLTDGMFMDSDSNEDDQAHFRGRNIAPAAEDMFKEFKGRLTPVQLCEMLQDVNFELCDEVRDEFIECFKEHFPAQPRPGLIQRKVLPNPPKMSPEAKLRYEKLIGRKP